MRARWSYVKPVGVGKPEGKFLREDIIADCESFTHFGVERHADKRQNVIVLWTPKAVVLIYPHTEHPTVVCFDYLLNDNSARYTFWYNQHSVQGLIDNLKRRCKEALDFSTLYWNER